MYLFYGLREGAEGGGKENYRPQPPTGTMFSPYQSVVGRSLSVGLALLGKLSIQT